MKKISEPFKMYKTGKISYIRIFFQKIFTNRRFTQNQGSPKYFPRVALRWPWAGICDPSGCSKISPGATIFVLRSNALKIYKTGKISYIRIFFLKIFYESQIPAKSGQSEIFSQSGADSGLEYVTLGVFKNFAWGCHFWTPFQYP